MKLWDFLAGSRISETVGPQFAFKRGHQCHEIVFILRRLIEIANEWRIHVFVLDGDIQKAYDNTRHPIIAESLDSKDLDRILSAAILREVAGPQVTLQIAPCVHCLAHLAGYCATCVNIMPCVLHSGASRTGRLP